MGGRVDPLNEVRCGWESERLPPWRVRFGNRSGGQHEAVPAQLAMAVKILRGSSRLSVDGDGESEQLMLFSAWLDGEIGRRTGLKILWP